MGMTHKEGKKEERERGIIEKGGSWKCKILQIDLCSRHH